MAYTSTWKRIQGTPANGGVNNTAYAWKCTITWESGDDAAVPPTRTPIRGDFTYIVEEVSDVTTAMAAIKIQGSLDNSTWIDLATGSNTAVQTAPTANAYDLDDKGKLPFMCVEVDPHANDDECVVNVYVVDHLE